MNLVRKVLITLILLLTPRVLLALNFNSTYFTLDCEGRGRTDILLHYYGHVDEKWDGNFEVGSGHKVSKNTEIITFSNGDILFHGLKNDHYFLFYSHDMPPKIHKCYLLSKHVPIPMNLKKNTK